LRGPDSGSSQKGWRALQFRTSRYRDERAPHVVYLGLEDSHWS
jgi:hypothetical protein